MPRPPTRIDLEWEGELRFRARAGEVALAVDGDGRSAVSPVQALAAALAACMAADVVHILKKGRQDLRALSARLTGWRAEEDPRRLLRVELLFTVAGDVAPDKVERAIALSRETYCSVWHSLRQDIDFQISHEIAGR